ncbi:hypothetical protein E1B28_008507 [Marasmius oreades]|uniref:C2H2-type domain-containing protein n=1 Tax=Marasmius oreades TaxID=181124 RepID=A0A9P7US70_9AGAR|nr:uncharacterized protein E1B28_008507 [Marasmius oreades]KAG7092133.1 hypothetical protein E1B28_008507 [Marasmius oreades]
MFHQIPCPYQGCLRTFALQGHLTKHTNAVHQNEHRNLPTPPIHTNFDEPGPSVLLITPELEDIAVDPVNTEKHYHPILSGWKCDANGNRLPHGAPPEGPPVIENEWEPFANEAGFRIADLLYRKVEMSHARVNELLDIWFHDVSTRYGGTSAPFSSQQHLYEMIDSIKHGSVPWCCLETEVEPPEDTTPEYLKSSYQVWYRDPDTVLSNILSNQDFSDDFDTAPYVHVNKDSKCCWSDFMSGNYAFNHAVHFLYQEFQSAVLNKVAVLDEHF